MKKTQRKGTATRRSRVPQHLMLDRTREFGAVIGLAAHKYEQDGKRFDVHGVCMDDPGYKKSDAAPPRELHPPGVKVSDAFPQVAIAQRDSRRYYDLIPRALSGKDPEASRHFALAIAGGAHKSDPQLAKALEEVFRRVRDGESPSVDHAMGLTPTKRDGRPPGPHWRDGEGVHAKEFDTALYLLGSRDLKRKVFIGDMEELHGTRPTLAGEMFLEASAVLVAERMDLVLREWHALHQVLIADPSNSDLKVKAAAIDNRLKPELEAFVELSEQLAKMRKARKRAPRSDRKSR